MMIHGFRLICQPLVVIPFPKARSVWGLLTRVSAKVAALNLGIQVNRQLGRPDLALATLFNC